MQAINMINYFTFGTSKKIQSSLEILFSGSDRLKNSKHLALLVAADLLIFVQDVMIKKQNLSGEMAQWKLKTQLTFEFAVNYQPVPSVSGTHCGCFSIAETK